MVRQFLFDAHSVAALGCARRLRSTRRWRRSPPRRSRRTSTTCATRASGSCGSATAPRRATRACSGRSTSSGATPASSSSATTWTTRSRRSASPSTTAGAPQPLGRDGAATCCSARDAHGADRRRACSAADARGRHTEHLGHLLAEMQIVARSHPGARRGSGRGRRPLTRERAPGRCSAPCRDPEVPVDQRGGARHRARRRGRATTRRHASRSRRPTPAARRCSRSRRTSARRSLDAGASRVEVQHGLLARLDHRLDRPRGAREAPRLRHRAAGAAPSRAGWSRSRAPGAPGRPAPSAARRDTRLQSEFGSTACKAIHVCNACRQPFDEFKAI